MKLLFILALFFAPILSFSQVGYIALFNNGPNMTTDRYVIGSGLTIPLCYAVEQIRDSSWVKWKFKQIMIPYLSNGSGSPNYLYTDASGALVASTPSWYTQTQSDSKYLQSFTELDPIYTAGIVNYYTKTASDIRYLQSYTETDPLFATKFAAQTTSGLTEGTNLYYTDVRAKAANAPTFNTITRPINATTYTISTTKNARVYYTISISCTATIGAASAGGVLLEYSTNGGSTYTSIGEVKNSNTVTLAIVLNSVNLQQTILSAEIPANALCRMTSTSTGTTTISYIRGQEITY